MVRHVSYLVPLFGLLSLILNGYPPRLRLWSFFGDIFGFSISMFSRFSIDVHFFGFGISTGSQIFETDNQSIPVSFLPLLFLQRCKTPGGKNE